MLWPAPQVELHLAHVWDQPFVIDFQAYWNKENWIGMGWGVFFRKFQPVKAEDSCRSGAFWNGPTLSAGKAWKNGFGEYISKLFPYCLAILSKLNRYTFSIVKNSKVLIGLSIQKQL